MSVDTAVMMIDMLVDYFDRVSELSVQRPRLVDAINELVMAARRAGYPIIWVRQEFRPDLSDAFLDMRRRHVAVTIAGTEGAKLLPELSQAASDHVIVKKRYSAFFGTHLDDLLATLGVRSLIIGGINTHACVRSTIIDAYQRDLDVTLAADCTGSYDAEHHAVTIRYVDGKIADVRTNAAILGRISTHAG